MAKIPADVEAMARLDGETLADFWQRVGLALKEAGVLLPDENSTVHRVRGTMREPADGGESGDTQSSD